MAISLFGDSQKFDESSRLLYHKSGQETAARFEELYRAHAATHSGEIRMFSSPGRIEICGNHTDHNHGKVLCAAVTIDTLGAVTPRDDNIITVDSEGYDPVVVDIDDLKIDPDKFGTTFALVQGVVAGLVNRGYKAGGFDATVRSNVFKGAGVSSSASFELLVTEILNVLYNDGKMEAMEKASVSQYAENVYFGKPSGLLDQSAIALGGVSFIDFKSLSAPVVKKTRWSVDDVDIVIVNCGGDHCNLTPNYAAIRSEMEQVAKLFGKPYLRRVSEKAFYEAIPEIRNKVSERALLRAIHFYDENARVVKLSNALKSGNVKKSLETINASGESSYKLLQNCYPEGTTEQPIPLALTLTKRFSGARAVRVHGGGFAGTILAIVDKHASSDYVSYMGNIFGKENVFVLGIREAGATEVKF